MYTNFKVLWIEPFKKQIVCYLLYKTVINSNKLSVLAIVSGSVKNQTSSGF